MLKGLEILKSELTKLKEDYDYAPEMKIILNKFDSRTAIAHDVLAAMFSNNEYKDNILVKEVVNFISKDKKRPICTPIK